MIIDSHVHIGTILSFDMPEAHVLSSMQKHGIAYSLVSNIEGCEVDHDQKPIPIEAQVSQMAINRRTLAFAAQHPDKIGAMLWAKPHEGVNPDFERLIVENRSRIYGIKVHPYHAKLSFGGPEVRGYLELARKYDLPVVTHTANDDESSPRVCYEVAKAFPDVKIVMYHFGLATDNAEAIELVSRLPNLYGDTSWVKPERVLEAIRICGPDKVLFGTDNPINGPETYNDPMFYNFYFDEARSVLPTQVYEKLMYRNAIKLFKLSQFDASV
jgi:predicted TIM-barrel fold metal-dependent hydrolase